MSDDRVTKLLERAAQRGEARGADEVWRRATRSAGRSTRPFGVGRALVVAAAVVAVIGGVALALIPAGDLETVTEAPRTPGIALADIPEGVSAWVIGDRHAFISREGAKFTVFVAYTHHLPEDTLLWCQDDNMFSGVEHGEQFDRLGQKIGGPQSADLSRMSSTVKDQHLLVDPWHIIPGAWVFGPQSPAPPARHHPTWRFTGCEDGVGGDDHVGTDPGERRRRDVGPSPNPDFLPALGRDGGRVGYLRKDGSAGSAPAGGLVPLPVYGEDLTTLVGHMYPQGFVPLGARPPRTRSVVTNARGVPEDH